MQKPLDSHKISL